MRYYSMAALLSAALLLLSCTERKVLPQAGIDFADLVPVMYDYSATDTLGRPALIEPVRTQAEAFVKVISGEPMSDSVLTEWSTRLTTRVFTPAVDSVYPSREPVREALARIVGGAEAEGLELPRRSYATVVYGRPEAILFVDSVMLVALNHFLGADYDGYGRWPQYIRQHKTPEALPYAMAEALVATSYPYRADAEGATLLSRMLYEGALMRAVAGLVQDGDIRKALGYNEDDYAWLEANEAELWTQIVGSRLLYDTSEAVADRFVSPAPALRGLDTLWPGRAGRYIGVRIVESYLGRHPEATPAFLLSPAFYASPTVLAESGYKP